MCALTGNTDQQADAAQSDAASNGIVVMSHRDKKECKTTTNEETQHDDSSEETDLLSKSNDKQDEIQANKQETLSNSVSMATNLSLFVNILLLIAKIIAFAMTWSYAVIASLVDSVLDLLSQFIIWLTERKVKKKNDHKYPVGKTRLEPVGILTVSVLMIMLSVIVVRESIQSLITDSHGVEWSIIGVTLLGGMTATPYILYFHIAHSIHFVYILMIRSDLFKILSVALLSTI